MKTLATIYHGQMNKVWKTYMDNDRVNSSLMNEMGLLYIRTIEGEEVRINLTKIDYIEYEEIKESL